MIRKWHVCIVDIFLPLLCSSLDLLSVMNILWSFLSYLVCTLYILSCMAPILYDSGSFTLFCFNTHVAPWKEPLTFFFTICGAIYIISEGHVRVMWVIQQVEKIKCKENIKNSRVFVSFWPAAMVPPLGKMIVCSAEHDSLCFEPFRQVQAWCLMWKPEFLLESAIKTIRKVLSEWSLETGFDLRA